MIQIHADVKHHYEGKSVVDVDASYESGKLYAILGPNGSGKSTLLRILSFIEEPDTGGVDFVESGRPLIKDIQLKHRIVMVPDRRGLFNDTVLENVQYGLKVRKISKSERSVIAEETLETVGLLDKQKVNALVLSNGEAQRLCLAMALAVSPEIILLDEPTASLDPYNAAMVEDIIKDMKSRVQLVLLVTHNMFQAERLSDIVTFMYEGRVIETSETRKFFKSPESIHAREFLKGETVY